MNQPVRVELTFPRSGQQLFVSVPRHITDLLEAERTDQKPHYPIHFTLVSDSAPISREHPSRPQ